MILSENTLGILKNFSQINSGIYIKKGNQLATAEKVSKVMVGYATVVEQFPVDFGIYDLNKLLSIISMSKEPPEIQFDEFHMIITSFNGRSKIKYRFCSEEMLTVPSDTKVSLPSEDINFLLEQNDYTWVSNAAKILETPNVAIKNDGNKVVLATYDAKNDSIPDQTLELKIDPVGAKYNIVLDLNLWNKLIPASYIVTISKDAILHFKMQGKEIEYFILADSEASDYENV